MELCFPIMEWDLHFCNSGSGFSRAYAIAREPALVCRLTYDVGNYPIGWLRSQLSAAGLCADHYPKNLS
jgi:hypothetical protein